MARFGAGVALMVSIIVRYLVDSAVHLGRFYLVDAVGASGEAIILLEGPDGRFFLPSEELPVLSGVGKPVTLRGSDVVLVWIVYPRRGQEEIRAALRYLAQWPGGPPAKLSCW
jgi:hypothetical protein